MYNHYLTFDRKERREMAEPMIDAALRHNHSVIQASILHCLGHQVDSQPEFVRPKLEEFLRRVDLQTELREYALQCKTGNIQ